MKQRIELLVDVPDDLPEGDLEELRQILEYFGYFTASRVIRRTHANFSYRVQANLGDQVSDEPARLFHSEGVIGE